MFALIAFMLAGGACEGGARTGGSGGLSGGSGGGGGMAAGSPASGGSGEATGGSPATGGATGGAAAASGEGSASGGSVGTGGAATAGDGGRGHPGTGGASGGAAAIGSGGSGSGGAAGGRGGGGNPGAGGNGGAGGAALPADCPGAAYDGTRPTPLTLTGSLGAHDPAALVAGTTIYLAATGLVAKTSPDLKTWQSAAPPLALPDWARSATGAKDLWAPDLASFGGAYHLYYAASTFGSNKSCIGHATRPTLDGGAWIDQGMVLCSNTGGTKDDWNAIDPNIALDEAGAPWMVFGSFWSGIKAVKLDTSGRRADDKIYAIANHADGGIEGAWIFRRCGAYYLFVSWGACCSGAYDYNIRVGRATTITGPYVDKAGSPMLSGGGTQLVKGDTSWVAPGHNAVITYGGKTYNLYHALKGSSAGAPTLRVSELVWDADGWPISGGP